MRLVSWPRLQVQAVSNERMRDTMAQRLHSLLCDLNDAELTLLPTVVAHEVAQRIDRASRDVASAERELDKRRTMLAEVQKRFEAKP